MLELRDIIGIRQETDIEDQIGFQRQPVFEPEGDDAHVHRMLPHPARDQIDKDPAQLTGGEDGGVDDGAGPVAHGRKELALPPDGVRQRRAVFHERVQTARLFIALDDDLSRGLDI